MSLLSRHLLDVKEQDDGVTLQNGRMLKMVLQRQLIDRKRRGRPTNRLFNEVAEDPKIRNLKEKARNR